MADLMRKNIFKMTYENQLALVDYLGIKNELSNVTYEIHEGHPEKAGFADYKDLDNNWDRICRDTRNHKTINAIFDIINNSPNKDRYYERLNTFMSNL